MPFDAEKKLELGVLASCIGACPGNTTSGVVRKSELHTR